MKASQQIAGVAGARVRSGLRTGERAIPILDAQRGLHRLQRAARSLDTPRTGGRACAEKQRDQRGGGYGPPAPSGPAWG